MTAGSNFAGYKSNFQNFMFYIINLKKKSLKKLVPLLKEVDPLFKVSLNWNNFT